MRLRNFSFVLGVLIVILFSIHGVYGDVMPECSDGDDNDDDGYIDYPADQDCFDEEDDNEWSDNPDYKCVGSSPPGKINQQLLDWWCGRPIFNSYGSCNTYCDGARYFCESYYPCVPGSICGAGEDCECDPPYGPGNCECDSPEWACCGNFRGGYNSCEDIESSSTCNNLPSCEWGQTCGKNERSCGNSGGPCENCLANNYCDGNSYVTYGCDSLNWYTQSCGESGSTDCSMNLWGNNDPYCDCSCGDYIGENGENSQPGWCADGIDNDCDGDANIACGQAGSFCDLDDPDCIVSNDCVLLSASIQADCDPDCGAGDTITMTLLTNGNCINNYPNLFLQINAQDGQDPQCIIAETGPSMIGISSNPNPFGERVLQGIWTIPEVPDACLEKDVWAQDGKVLESEGGNLIDNLAYNQISGNFKFAGASQGPCDLTSASWRLEEVDDEARVELIIAGTNCAGEMISFEIKEIDDGLCLDDDITVLGPFEFGSQRVEWVAEYRLDDDENMAELCLGTDDPPEYKFTATVVSSGESQDSINELKVNEIDLPGPGDCDDIHRCWDYEESNSCNDDAGNCNVAYDSCKELHSEDFCNTHTYNCGWSTQQDPEECVFVWSGGGGGGGDPGTCFSHQESDDTCEDDGWLSYSIVGVWKWDPDNNGYGNRLDCEFNNENCDDCCTQRNGQGPWHYDPNRMNEQCQTTTNVVPCSSQAQLPFFTFTNIVAIVILIVLVYFYIGHKKNKKK